MDDLTEKIGELLNDEESMQQIKELADMLTGSASMGQTENTSASGEAESFDPDYGESGTASSADKGFPDLSALFGMAGGGNDTSGEQSSGIDIGTMMKLVSVIGKAEAEDKNRALIASIKPFLSADKQARADKAMRFLKLYAIWNELKRSGLTSDLSKIL